MGTITVMEKFINGLVLCLDLIVGIWRTKQHWLVLKGEILEIIVLVKHLEGNIFNLQMIPNFNGCHKNTPSVPSCLSLVLFWDVPNC